MKNKTTIRYPVSEEYTNALMAEEKLREHLGNLVRSSNAAYINNMKKLFILLVLIAIICISCEPEPTGPHREAPTTITN